MNGKDTARMPPEDARQRKGNHMFKHCFSRIFIGSILTLSVCCFVFIKQFMPGAFPVDSSPFHIVCQENLHADNLPLGDDTAIGKLLDDRMYKWLKEQQHNMRFSITSYAPLLVIESDNTQVIFLSSLVVVSFRRADEVVWHQFTLKHDLESRNLKAEIQNMKTLLDK